MSLMCLKVLENLTDAKILNGNAYKQSKCVSS